MSREEGSIENALIHYERPNQKGSKHAQVTLFASEPGSSLKDVLTNAPGVKAVVDKKREIYFIDNVRLSIQKAI